MDIGSCLKNKTKHSPHFLAHANGQNATTQEVNLRTNDRKMSNYSKWITSFKHNLAYDHI